MDEKKEIEQITTENVVDKKSSTKKEKRVMVRDAKPKPHTKKELKERRMKKRQKEEERWK